MARIRSIKPEFWTSEQVMECSLNTRLMFIGMWNFADDAGRMPLSPKTIKAQIFPSDDIDSDNVRGMINELSSIGLILIYTVEGKEYLQITGWQHQRIDKPQKAKCPAPFFDNSTNDRGALPPDRIGEDRKGKDNAATAAPETSSEETDYFRRGKKILGDGAGGLIKNLLKAKGSIPLARAALEQASTKQDPREYIGAIVKGRGNSPEDLRARGEAW